MVTSLFLQTRDARWAYLDVDPQYGYEMVPMPKEIGKLSWVQYRPTDAVGAAVGRGWAAGADSAGNRSVFCVGMWSSLGKMESDSTPWGNIHRLKQEQLSWNIGENSSQSSSPFQLELWSCFTGWCYYPGQIYCWVHCWISTVSFYLMKSLKF